MIVMLRCVGRRAEIIEEIERKTGRNIDEVVEESLMELYALLREDAHTPSQQDAKEAGYRPSSQASP